MGLFDKLFNNNKHKNNTNTNNIIDISSFITKYNELLNQDIFLSRSIFNDLKQEYKEAYDFYLTLDKAHTIKNYCNNNKELINSINEFIDIYCDLTNNYEYIKKHNDDFINHHLESDKLYFDNILKDVDENIELDEEQRKVCLDDEDYSLIIAGAGAGKTTTLAAKVKYLVEKKHIDPKEILIIAFTNKAVNELKDKIQKKLKIDVCISTFHSCGRAIVRKDVNYADSRILDDNFWFVRDYVNNMVNKDKSLLQKMIMLFAYYLDLPEDITKKISLEDHFTLIERSDFSTIKGNIASFNKEFIEQKEKQVLTIQNERLRSFEEVQIANFLFLNSIDYEYEKPYEYPIPNANKIYTPDFYIYQGNNKCYIEHFGITEDGQNTRYTKQELDNYILNMKYKINHHQIHNTKLITTFSKYNDNRSIIDHLKEELLNKGFTLIPKNDEEVYNALKENKDNRYIYKFCNMASRFISLFKTKGYTLEEFEVFKSKTSNPRNLIFFDIMEQLYASYQTYLKENKYVDFEDMIVESARLLREVDSVKDKINFKYILVDEYQDISRARLNLVNEIKNATNAKITVVGDDWQAIYGYAGSEVNLFTRFVEQMGYASVLKIIRTYRNAQELIDIAGEFVQKNDAQIKKQLISNKHIEKPITLYTYDNRYKSKDNPGADYNKALLLENIIGLLVKRLDNEKTNILLVGRYNFEETKLIDTHLFHKTSSNQIVSNKYPQAKLTFMTAHSTKGLTYDNVVILNALNGKYGFPSQIEDDPLFNFVRTKDESYDFSEERRLFYVALTRTKNRVFITVPYLNPSTFILELLDDYQDKINLHEEQFKLNKDIVLLKNQRKRCPICGYPLQLQYNKAYGLKLYICTNEPEICDYMTNDLISGKKSIHLCKKCGGTMILKRRKDKSGFFFGCSNYKVDGSGCNNVENFE